VFAQDATPTAPAPTTPAPATTPPKHKAATNTAAHCNTLKTAHSKSACLKRVHSQSTAQKAATPHKKGKKVDPAKTATSATPTPPVAPSDSQTVTVPPLPEKTI
jgi:hypothetical protein